MFYDQAAADTAASGRVSRVRCRLRVRWPRRCSAGRWSTGTRGGGEASTRPSCTGQYRGLTGQCNTQQGTLSLVRLLVAPSTTIDQLQARLISVNNQFLVSVSASGHVFFCQPMSICLCLCDCRCCRCLPVSISQSVCADRLCNVGGWLAIDLRLLI